MQFFARWRDHLLGRGRLGTTGYLRLYRANLALVVAGIVAAVVFKEMPTLKIGAVGLIVGLFCWVNVASVIRRLHDFSKSGWFSLAIAPALLLAQMASGGSKDDAAAFPLLMIGLAFAVLSLFFTFKRGTAGPNQYGPDPRGD